MSVDSKARQTVPPDGRPDDEQPAWRRDFPIDVPQDQYVARRDFTRFLGLTSLAFVLGQFWIAVKSWLGRRRGGEAPERPVARLADVPVGSAVAFRYPGEEDPCLLLRPDEKTLLACGQKCTHLSCAVVPDLAGGRLHCPCHKGYFDLEGRPLAGPPRRPLPRVSLTVRDGVVYATGVEVRP